MASDIQIYLKNYSTVSVQCNNNITAELHRYLSAFAPNYRFMPLFKQGIWDGKLHFINSFNETPIGLVEKIYEFAHLGKYTIECMYERFNELAKHDYDQFVEMLQLPFPIYDYQYAAIYEALTKKVINVHIATAGGKSLVIYALSRFLSLQGKKILIICNTTQLVEQMFGDFQSYGWDAEEHCHRIYGGQRKIFDHAVSISTWQSLATIKDKKMFAMFDCIMCDEAQGAKAKEITKISNACINAEYRFGFSGTYPETNTADWFAIVGSFGPVKTFASYKKLQEDKRIVPIKIYTVRLKYKKEFKFEVYTKGKGNYNDENDLIYGDDARCAFLCKMVQNMKENVLVLFQKKEKHGHVLKELFEKTLKGKKILYIDGTIDVLDRDEYRALMENAQNIVLLATYATLSAGTNIRNLPNIILASSYKSKIKILQSIGRGLRLHKDKKCLKLFDVVDDCAFKTKTVKFINYSLKHSKERQKYYAEQSWPWKEITFEI